MFDSDVTRPPPPPRGAGAVELRDDAGRVIAFAWVVAEHDDSLFHASAHNYLNARLIGDGASDRDVLPLAPRSRQLR